MVSVIVFSKDRTLQLHGYLESLFHFSDITQDCVTVLFNECTEISYRQVINTFPEVNWVRETNFPEDLAAILSQVDQYVMFGCDDVVFTSKFSFQKAIETLDLNKDVFGFSMRLGKNIQPRPSSLKKCGSVYQWRWRGCQKNHWNYPWELDCTIYRKQDVFKILDTTSLNPRNPNYLEGDIAAQVDTLIERPDLACFTRSCSLVITVNRVQDTHQNPFDSEGDSSVHSLHERYERGERMDISAISKKKNRVIHVDSSYLLLEEPSHLGSKLQRSSVSSSIWTNLSRFIKTIMNACR